MNAVILVVNPLGVAVAAGLMLGIGRLAGDRLSRHQLWDATLVLVLVGIAQEEIWFPHLSFDNRVGPTWLAVAGTTLAAVVLLWRRREPLLVLAAVSAITLVRALLGGGVTGLGFLAPILVATYSVGRYERRLPLAPAAVVSAALAVGIALTDNFLDPTHSTEPALIAFAILFMAVMWGLGRLLLAREHAEKELEETAARLERDREERARRAVTEERGRIARELHDVVAHHVSVIIVQAQAASAVLGERPEAAARALDRIENTAREAMTEMRRLVNVLDEGDASGAAPQPGVGQIPELLARVRAAGVAVDFDSEGDLGEMPVGLNLTTYRIVQEAVTNVIKHSGARSVQVRISRSAANLRILVLDDGHGTGPSTGGGRGLAGMRQRVTLYGGQLDAGARPEGGFAVTAVIPFESVPA